MMSGLRVHPRRVVNPGCDSRAWSGRCEAITPWPPAGGSAAILRVVDWTCASDIVYITERVPGYSTRFLSATTAQTSTCPHSVRSERITRIRVQKSRPQMSKGALHSSRTYSTSRTALEMTNARAQRDGGYWKWQIAGEGTTWLVLYCANSNGRKHSL